MRKNVLCALTALFFGLMLFGTLFHQKIDRMFRENVSVVSPQSYQEEVMQTWEVNGKKREIITTGTYFLIPKEAVQNNMVYVLETMEVPYGSYEVVRLKSVEIAGEVDGYVKIKNGLLAEDKVVVVFGENLEDGMRVVEDK
ncbi:MAG: hypothetical protein J6K15_03775 [Lachnospiraceae bacterium]|nr:hypothetical protein [Lachnospiraceae bacterium]